MKGIYIHIPFCRQKCNYCDFCSYPASELMWEEYAKAVAREAETFGKYDFGADTVYFGGGTPSLLPEKYIELILDSVRKNFIIRPDSEITVEVNPCTVTPDKMKNLKSIGINRISLGAQTFSDAQLRTLGRLHSSDDIKRSCEAIRKAGFSNLSLDLMYAIPGQSIDDLSTSVSEVLNLSPEHISCYGLKIEEGTPFFRMKEEGILTEKSDDEYADMYKLITDKLSAAGYLQYELSNFSQKGFESKHNLKYWLGGDYVGLGAGAASRISMERYTHTGDLERYMKSFENDESYTLSKEDAMSEYMFLSLRLTKLGASKHEFQRLFSVPCESVFGDAISRHLKLGLLLDEGDRYVLAPKAYYISNYVLCDFV